MNTLGSLGGIITKGVCSVSGSFQPFGGAVDVIVVEQADGSFKSSPWYVRFGKFQGVLKNKENIVKINVNGTKAKFHMYLNSKGQAFFLKGDGNHDVERSNTGDRWEDECSSSSRSTPFNSRRDNFVGSMTSPSSPDGGTPMPRTNSDQSEIIGSKLNSFECPEITAQLLDVNWSTCLPTGCPRKDGQLPDAADGVTGEKLELISKMGEDCNCHSESQKSTKPAGSRHRRFSRSEAHVYCSDRSGVSGRSDAFDEESIGKYQDHDESERDKERSTTRDTITSAKDHEEPRPVLMEINSDGNENVDVKGPGHRPSNSLDAKPASSKPPAVFCRSYGGREGHFLRRKTDHEGSDSVHSTKSAPADVPLEHDSELKRILTDKSMRIFSPTSDQLASLDLDAGGNVITFTFWTKMLGKQEVDARIYLWKWTDRIIISDVDGTITKSDVLGQCMPLVGMDWTQEGVARLYSSIKDNGYKLMFLSARSIAQSYITRQFLLNVKQDGIALPDGPVVISPDGLFPSLYREVIRRVPHEFKIACLEAIKALFPPDKNPFYAGFGNRDTDEISYLKVGIPKGKVFIINPKGEVVVNRHIRRSSYVSINTIVDEMFPSTPSSEEEEFNSWNFWKLPPPLIDD